MAAVEAPLLGYLVINVLEAAGHDAEDAPVWECDFKQGYARVEIRGGPRTVKKLTSTQGVADNGITWVEQLSLEVLEGASELRIMLCRPKQAGSERSSSIVAACGIYMKDILEAAPVDKYFELYKPGHGSAGGFIRVAISFLEPDQVRSGELEGSARDGNTAVVGKRGSGLAGVAKKVLVVGAVAAGVAFALQQVGKKGGNTNQVAAASDKLKKK